MIRLPRRSVTRFFIPLIDVLTLLFCVFLLLPLAVPEDENAEARDPAGLDEQRRQEQVELERLRRQVQETPQQVRDELERLRKEKASALQQRIEFRVLTIEAASGKLFTYDARRTNGRLVELTKDTVRALIDKEKREAAGKEIYFVFQYPRPEVGNPVFPLREQREEYDRWFQGVAHGYDIPLPSR